MTDDPKDHDTPNTPAPATRGGRVWSDTVRQRVGSARDKIPKLRGSIEQEREIVRGELARKLVRTLNITLVAVAALLVTSRWTGLDLKTAKEFFDPILSAVIALVSSALGFYFGSSERGRSEGGNSEQEEEK